MPIGAVFLSTKFLGANFEAMLPKILKKIVNRASKKLFPIYAMQQKVAGFKYHPNNIDLPNFCTEAGEPIDSQDVLRQLRENGAVAIPRFFEPATADAIREACLDYLHNHLSAENPPKVAIFDKKFGYENTASIDGVTRLYHVEKRISQAQSFALNPFMEAIGRAYYQQNVWLETTIFQHNQICAAGTRDWHIDSWLNQFKAFLYLSDVTDENGPFTYLLGSHKNEGYLLRKTFRSMRGEESTSVPDAEAGRLGLEAKAFTARKGTLLLADTKGIHQGGTLVRGDRSALVNYYYVGNPRDISDPQS